MQKEGFFFDYNTRHAEASSFSEEEEMAPVPKAVEEEKVDEGEQVDLEGL